MTFEINGVTDPAKICGIAIANISKVNGVSISNKFTFTVQTVGVDDTFALPLESSGTYDFTVEWGDSSSNNITVYNQAEVTHTYATGGSHTINISGTIYGWRFGDAGDKTKIYDISSWGPLRLGNNNGYFYGCTNLTISATDDLDLTNTTICISAFRSCISLTTVPSMNSWNTSLVTNMGHMFRDCSAFNQNIGSWVTSSVTTMYAMFLGCSVFNQNIGSWNTSLVTNMEFMFNSCSAFNQNIGSWNITSMASAASMFTNVTLSTTNYDSLLIGWELQSVQNNVTFDGGNSKYSAGAPATARADLIADHSWIITDGGQV